MKKSILNLAGAQELSKKEQKNINGGVTYACAISGCIGSSGTNCPTGYTKLTSAGVCPKGWCCPML